MSTTEASDMRKRPSTPKPVNESRRRLLGSAIGAGAAAGIGFAAVGAQAAPTAGAAVLLRPGAPAPAGPAAAAGSTAHRALP